MKTLLSNASETISDAEERDGWGKEYIAESLAEAWWEQQELDKEIIQLKEENKKLKDQIKKYENRWKMFNVEQELEIKLLTAEYGSEEIRNCMKENEKLKAENERLKKDQVEEIKTIKIKTHRAITKLNKKIKSLQ